MIDSNVTRMFPEIAQIPLPGALLPSSGALLPLQAGFLIEDIGRGVILVNPCGELTYINRFAADALQVGRETVIGRMVDMLPLRTPLYKVLSEQCRETTLEFAVKGRVFAARSKEVRSCDGASRGEMTEIWEITQERKAKREWEEFVAMTAHDLRSPLTVIMGYMQGIQAGMYGELGGKLRRALEQMVEGGEKLNAMIEEMLDMYRLEVGLLQLNRHRCSLEDILEGCCRDNVRTAQEQGVSLESDCTARLPDLLADGKLLARVFNNLIGNAIKYTPAGGKVSVTAEVDGNAFHVSVSDTGIGIPPEDLERIFFKYYRSAGAAGIKGTGLGLAITKAAIDAHGGSIEVESAIGAGSRFTVSMPVGSPGE